MSYSVAIATLSTLSAQSLGVFRGTAAVELGVSRNQLARFCRVGLLTREHADTYRMTAVARSDEQALRAALLWAGDEAAAAQRSAGWVYGLEGVRASIPEIVVPDRLRLRSNRVEVHRTHDRAALMLRTYRSLRVTGVEATMVALAATLGPEALEIACEDARRRQLTSVSALNAYLTRFPRRAGMKPLRRLLAELDPVHASRSTLEVKTRRLLVAHGFADFTREFPLEWNGRTYFFDFCFNRRRTILETNGERWHDDPLDYEDDNEKWSVPGRYGYRVVFATWDKVTRRPTELLNEIAATLAA